MEKPTIPKGTRDFGPVQMARRQFIFGNIRKVFEKYGFQPLETPAMENLSTLTGKYGDEGDQLLFKILNSGDFLKDANPAELSARNSKGLTPAIAEKGLRYDLTVPFARYVVANRHEITFPFKRYQIQPVWRADRPQKGRYREFYQCDADVVGTNSLICEAEIILMIREVFSLLSIHNYSIKINHRAILSGLAKLANAGDFESSLFVAIDKLDKIGADKVKDELMGRGITTENISAVFEVLDFAGTTSEKLQMLEERFEAVPAGKKGIDDLRQVMALLTSFGTDLQHVELDLALARGLSYYTGCIFEVKINNAAIGSVSGGGRYDNLTGGFGLPDVSGVGFSFGVDRLYDALEELKLFPGESQTTTRLLLAHTDESSMRYALSLASQFRENGISTEVYPDNAKIGKQLDYANKKKIAYAIVIGSNEISSGLYSIKDLSTGDQTSKRFEDILPILRTPLTN